MYVGTARERRERPPSPLIDTLFVAPTPSLEWTGDGIRRDPTGRLHFIRHAMEPGAATATLSVPSVEVPKLLIVEHLRSQSHADFQAWLTEHGGDESGAAAIANGLTDSGKTLLIGEQIAIGYEPRLARTRILWPWKTFTDAHEPVFMQAIWRCYFEAAGQPELRTQLLRWTSTG